MKFVLKNSGHHLPGNTREKHQNKLENIQEQIDQIEEILKDRGGLI